LRYYGPYTQTPLEAGFGRHHGQRQGLVLEIVALRRVLELVAYGLATARHIRVGGGRWLASLSRFDADRKLGAARILQSACLSSTIPSTWKMRV
jgi:hypothetical protein